MASSEQQQEPVAVLTLRIVKEACREKYEAAMHEFIAGSFKTEGQLGVHVIRPAPGSGSREYGIIRRFSSTEARDSFYRSEMFKEWEEKVAPMEEGAPVRQELSGLEAWFSLPGRAAVAQPPRWKMALVTLLGVYPVSVVVPRLLQPLIENLHPLVRAFLVALGIVVMLTWVVMPALVRILRPWLHPARRKNHEGAGTDSS